MNCTGILEPVTFQMAESKTCMDGSFVPMCAMTSIAS
jgi:hypothetical protein